MRAPGAQGAGRGEEGGGGGAGCRGEMSAGEELPLFFLLFGLFLFLCDFLGAHHVFLGQAWRKAEGSLQLAALCG